MPDQKPNSRSESTMTTPPPSARCHNNNLNTKLHCHSNKRYTKLICFALPRLLLIVLATSTPTSSLEFQFQCASFLPAFNDSFHFNPRVILDKIKPETTSAMRAWTCHGRTHKEMVEKLKSAGIIKSPINEAALLSVDRRNYVSPNNVDYAYEDSPQPIGLGATISAPHMHAHVLEDLLPSLLRASQQNPTQPLSILDVGCGSGYLTAVFGRMLGGDSAKKDVKKAIPLVLNRGKVYGIDVIPELVELSRRNMMKADGDLLLDKTKDGSGAVVELIARDGWGGYPPGSPYNVIHVGAAASTFPIQLMKQLAVGGMMVIPVGPDGGTQYLYKVERLGDHGGGSENIATSGFYEDDYVVQRVLGVRYVPLIRTDN